MTVDIDIRPDWVDLFAHRVRRPDGISPSQWIEFWNGVNGLSFGDYDEGYNDGYHQGLAEGKED